MPTLHWLTRDDDLRVASRLPYEQLREVLVLSAGAQQSFNDCDLPLRVVCFCHAPVMAQHGEPQNLGRRTAESIP